MRTILHLISLAVASLPNQMAMAGYRTATIGKYHVAPEAVFHFEQYIHRPQFELFDIAADPDENKNLSADPNFAVVLETYKTKLKAMQKRPGDRWIMKWNYE